MMTTLAKAIDEYINPQSSQHKIQIAFTAVVALMGLMLAMVFPFFLAYGLNSYLTYTLIRTIPKWVRLARPDYDPNTPFYFDPKTNIAILTGTLLLGFQLWYLPAFFQMVFLTLQITLTAGFFVQQCVFGSQKALNKALHKAILANNLNHVEILLARGADPLAPNCDGNHALYLSIQDTEQSVEMLQKLIQKATLPPETFKDFLASFKTFLNDDFHQKGLACWEATVKLAEQRDQTAAKAWFNTLQTLWDASVPVFENGFAHLVDYLRSEGAFRPKSTYQNQAGHTLLDFANTLPMAEERRKQIHAILKTFRTHLSPKNKKENKQAEQAVPREDGQNPEEPILSSSRPTMLFTRSIPSAPSSQPDKPVEESQKAQTNHRNNTTSL